ncbi:cadmium resistance transporter [Longispora albida]|uniref:cadmium resistance transporter n=1 Tax=Longispora albida TaxID=203523 RepID=UPI00037E31E5|nr:cadmium resistance transporter [Longispora albida]
MNTVLTAIGVFAGTNVDDLLVLTVLFLSARATGKPRPWQIWAGQYLGIGILVAIAAAGALGLALVPGGLVRFLGLIPIALGVKALVSRRSGEDGPVVAAGPISVAGVTIVNGADNISVYLPLFRTIGLAASLVTVAVFALLVAAWCLAGSWLGSHRRVVALVERWGHWLVPCVFIAIGTVILLG